MSSQVLNTTFLKSIPGKQVMARMRDCGKTTTFLKFARRKKVNVCIIIINRDFFLLSGKKKVKEGKTSKKE